MTDSEYDAIARQARETRERAEQQFLALPPSEEESEHIHAQHAEYGAAAH